MALTPVRAELAALNISPETGPQSKAQWDALLERLEARFRDGSNSASRSAVQSADRAETPDEPHPVADNPRASGEDALERRWLVNVAANGQATDMSSTDPMAQPSTKELTVSANPGAPDGTATELPLFAEPPRNNGDAPGSAFGRSADLAWNTPQSAPSEEEVAVPSERARLVSEPGKVRNGVRSMHVLARRRDRILSAVAGIGAMLLNADQWEAVLPEALAAIGEATEVSRAYLFRHVDRPDGTAQWSMLFEWCAPEIAPQIASDEYRDYDPVASGFGEWVDGLRRGEVRWMNVRDVSDERRRALEAQDIQSILQAPVFVDDTLWGCIGLDDCWTERSWTTGEIDALTMAATTLGAAIRAQQTALRLRQSDTLVRTLVNSVPGAIYRCELDSQRTMRSLSGAITDITGYDRSELLHNAKLSYGDIIHPTDRSLVEDAVAQAIAEDRAFDIRYRVFHRDGGVRWVWERGQAVRRAPGAFDALVGVIIEVTDEQRRRVALNSVTEELAASERRFRSLVSNIPGVVYRVRSDGAVDFVSDAIESLTGIPASAFRDGVHSLIDLIDAEERLAFAAEVARAVEERRPYVFTYAIRRNDGATRWVRDQGAPVHGDDGSVKWFDGAMFDITDQRQAEAALEQANRELAESEARYRNVVANVPGAIYRARFDQQWSVSFVTDPIAEITGYSAEEFTSGVVHLGDLILPEDKQRCEPQTIAAIAQRSQYSNEYRLRRRDGAVRWVLDQGLPVLRPDGKVQYLDGMLFDITARKQAEAELKEREEYFRALIENINDMVSVLNADGAVRYASPSVTRTLGYTPEEVIGESAFGLVTAAEQSEQLALLGAQIPDASTTATFVGRVQARDGTHRIVETVASNQLANPAIRGIVVNSRDITDRVEAEQKIRRRNEVFNVLNETTLAIFLRQDINQLLTTIAERAAQALGAEHGYVNLLAPNGRWMYVAAARGYFSGPGAAPERIYPGQGATGVAWATRKPVIIADYSKFPQRLTDTTVEGVPLSSMAVPMFSGDTVIGVIGIAFDEANHAFAEDEVFLLSRLGEMASLAIENQRLYAAVEAELAERRETERALRRSETRTRALLDAIPDTMIRVDENGVVLDYSPGRQLSLALTRDHVIGQFVHTIFPPSLANTFLKNITHAIDSREAQTFEYQMFQHGRSVDREARVVPGSDHEALVIIRDISERKRVDRLKNEFVSTVSHELRTPLTSIRGSLGLVAAGVAGELTPQARNLVEIAYKNSERLVRLINDILDIEKIESGKMRFEFRRQPLTPVIHQAIEDNRGFASQYNVTFCFNAPATPIDVEIDSDRIIQVLTNLLSNAVKFSPSGGEVEVTLEVSPSTARISVRDRGPGIPKDFHERIFQKFAQADSSDTRQKGGTGLGLSIAKAIVERHGGVLGFSSVEGEGTTFTFELPRAIDEPAAAGAASLATGAPVLIIEDDLETALAVAALLETAGFVTWRAETLAAARSALAERHFAAITLDLMMPDGDGLAFLRALRADARTRTTPVVVVSIKASAGEEEMASEMLSLVDWFDKPFNGQRLVEAIRQACAGNAKPARLLHVEDDPDVRAIVRMLLEPMAQIVSVESLEHAKRVVAHDGAFDVVLLDLSLSDGSGLDLLPCINASSPGTPVILFSASEAPHDVVDRIAGSLVKSRTPNEQLVATIGAVIERRRGASPLTSA